VSYSIDRSRSGTRAEFVDMVNRCKTAGVDIYVDAVINHMTNFPSPGVGSNGTAYSKYEYPGLYTASDFHTPCTVSNYSNAANVASTRAKILSSSTCCMCFAASMRKPATPSRDNMMR